ncbi:hypothetical protein [Arthrobacter sp. RCC_34]|uniref:hypothetical protein n=1 Tax=Arthrobacter sp. RCC_34 TaxID=3239230 RepID=UPI0035237FB9
MGQITAASRMLGRDLMPWQKLVAQVAGERRIDDPRRYRYPIVCVTVPRQSGKTTLMRTVLAQRAIANRNRVAFYTAQTGKDAVARWADLVKDIEQGPLARFVEKRIAAGSQALTFPTGSRISPFAPTAKSLHGYTPHDVMLDEIFAWDAAQGADLMGAIKPAQLTLKDKQLWLVSTAGHAGSEFLKSWVDAGRLAVDDPGAGVAYFEWSMPEGLDPYDPASWAFHPALGHTITAEDLASDAESQTRGEWMRAYMNVWTGSVEPIFDMDAWEKRRHVLDPAPWHQVTVAYEVAYDRSSAAVWGVYTNPASGRPALKLIKAGPGAEWVAPEVAKLDFEHRPRAIYADDAGPTRIVTDQLRTMPSRRAGAKGIDVQTLSSKDFATGCAAFKAHVSEGGFDHDAGPEFARQMEGAVSRPMGEGWVLSRRDSRVPIPDLIAGVVALRGHEQAPPTLSKPKVRF